MRNLKESSSLEIYTKYNKIYNTIIFSIKNSSKFKAHKYFISKNLKKDNIGAYSIGYCLNLKYNLDLKYFKMEVSE